MTPDEIRSLIPQYLAGELSPQQSALLEAHLQTDDSLRAEIEDLRDLWQQLGLLPAPEPSPSLRARFYQQLNAEVNPRPASSKPAKKSFWNIAPAFQFAAAAFIFLLGLAVGNWVKPSAQPRTEIAQLQTQVEGLRQTVALSLMQKPSASSRLEGVEWSSQVARPDQELMVALQTTLDQDPNINVRLAALDALEKYTSQPAVRKALEQSISKQQSPLVQIALIDALVHIQDRSAAEEFKQLSGNARVNAVVRQRAQWAVEKLSLN